MPKEVYEKLRHDEIPDYAGVIILDPDKLDYWKRLRPKIVKRGKRLPLSTKATDRFRIDLLTVAHKRLWAAIGKDAAFLDAKDDPTTAEDLHPE
jgi:predicted small integral membrane protein